MKPLSAILFRFGLLGVVLSGLATLMSLWFIKLIESWFGSHLAGNPFVIALVALLSTLLFAWIMSVGLNHYYACWRTEELKSKNGELKRENDQLRREAALPERMVGLLLDLRGSRAFAFNGQLTHFNDYPDQIRQRLEAPYNEIKKTSAPPPA